MAFWAALGAAALPLVQPAADIWSAQYQAKKSLEAQGRQMEFEGQMSSTAHQREVADLKAAGLNPILSARYGGSATPSASAASIAKPDIDFSGSTSALSTMRLNKQLEKKIEKETIVSASEAAVAAKRAEFDTSDIGMRFYKVKKAAESIAPIAAIAGGSALAVNQISKMMNSSKTGVIKGFSGGGSSGSSTGNYRNKDQKHFFKP